MTTLSHLLFGPYQRTIRSSLISFKYFFIVEFRPTTDFKNFF